MRKTIDKIICDRCKAEQTNDYAVLPWLKTVIVKRYKRIDVVINGNVKHFDLCPSCCNKLYKWVTNYGKEESNTEN